MAFSAGRVFVRQVGGGQISGGIVRAPQSGLPPMTAAVFTAYPNDEDPSRGALNDADIAVKDQARNRNNPYGIPGVVGPDINIPRAAAALRGREAPPIIEIDRRTDPQYSNRGLGAALHAIQSWIPGRPTEGQTDHLNTFDLPNRRELEAKDPEWLARHGGGRSRTATSQEMGIGDAHSQLSELGPGGLNEGPAPSRIPHVWNDGLNAAAGMSQYGFQQQNYRLFLKHPMIGRVRFPTRGIRAVSGIRGQMSTASTVRIPAIFVPSAVG